jgi:hypothetical protein
MPAIATLRACRALPSLLPPDRHISVSYSLTFYRYWAFLLARRCEFDASARVLLQIWEHGGGSDLTSDRITHFLILSLDSGHARSWSSSGHEQAYSDVHDCTVGVASCPDITPPLPSPAACRRNWHEYTGGSFSQAISSAAAAARSLLAKVPHSPHLHLIYNVHLTCISVAACSAPPVRQRQQQQARGVLSLSRVISQRTAGPGPL